MSKARTYELNACTLHGCDCEEPVTAIDARDVEGLVAAVRETFCDDAPCARCAHLRAALARFDSSAQLDQGRAALAQEGKTNG